MLQSYWNAVVLEAVSLIKEGKSSAAVELLRIETEFCDDMGIAYLFASCPLSDRALLATCLSGYLNRTPDNTRLVAAPVLACVHPARCYRNGTFLPEPYPPREEIFVLPTAEPGADDPAPHLRLLGWLDARTIYPRAQHQLAKMAPYGIEWGKISAAVALFEWNASPASDCFPTISDQWWAQLFCRSDIVAKVHTPPVFDYSEAAEAAHAMSVGASSCFTEDEGFQDLSLYYFTLHGLQRLANHVGMQFRAQCDAGFPEHPQWRAEWQTEWPAEL
jgi:hypothetical protein